MEAGKLRLGLGCALLAMAMQACALNEAPAAHTTPEDRLAAMRPVSSAMLQNPAPGDWLQWGRTYDGHNFSPLNRINRTNVKDLQPAWNAPLQNGVAMPTPLVHDGVMFLNTSPDTVLALDAATGKELWRHAHPVAQGVSSTMKMGLSLSGGRVFVPTSDLHVLALDAKTGATVWDHSIEVKPPAVRSTTLGLRSAPFIVGDKVIQGVTASFVAGGGFIVALDINTG